jgi:hypothetical protein
MTPSDPESPQRLGRKRNDRLIDEWTYVAKSAVSRPKGLAALWPPGQLGLFARKDIPAGTMIGEYSGDEITADGYKEGDTDYVLWITAKGEAQAGVEGILPSTRGIDGKTNLRYANHSRHAFNMAIRLGSEIPRFYAVRDIRAGEELTWQYGNFDY